ncbi:polysaccharide deacetylase family protein [Paenibacillus sp. DYY-L-2]|uniref:polysaccharide deacetylase family protein n=1 Tax=Paenibacillus sp. DYY-L-2 TaxID=3447013 RepID=UPI003F50CCD8
MMSRKREEKSNPKFKPIVIAAILLSSVSLVMSAYAANSVYHRGQSHDASSSPAVISSPKFAASGDAVTGNEDQPILVMEEQVMKEQETDAGSGAQKESNTEKKEEKPAATPEKKTQKVIYLTFDDGPGKYTDKIVEILNEKKIHATFFMIGNQLSDHEKSVKAAAEAGNYIGLHSMTHNKKTLYKSGGSAKFIKEFKQEQAIVEKITGTKPWLIRAPYGSKPEIDKQFRTEIADADFKMWDWTVDSKDWSYPGEPERIIREVKRQVHRDTEVILMHEKSQTVQALPEIIEYLQKKGYAFAVYKPEQHISVNFAKDTRL